MIIDFLIHGKISNKHAFNKEMFSLTINEARNEGITSIALTEHCHAINFFEGYDFLNENYKLINDYFDVDGIKVFYGIKVTTREKLDFLFIGNSSLIVELKNNVDNNKNGDKFLAINKLFEIYIKNNLLVILAHPYRKHDELPSISTEIIDKLDAIEYNARDLYEHGIDHSEKQIIDLVYKFSMPIVCGSDTPHFIQMGSVKNIFTSNCDTIHQIKDEIQKFNYYTWFSEALQIRVRSAMIIKNLIISENNK